MNKNIRFSDIEIKSIIEDSGEVIIEGYGAVFGNIDSYGDVIRKGAFKKTIEESGSRIALCYQHDIYSPIGKITALKEDDYGLYIEARISDSEPDIKTKIKEDILKEMSIGYRPINAVSAVIDGVDVLELVEIKLYEVSIVTIAANDKAVITGMKSNEKIDYVSKEFDRISALCKSNKNLEYEILKLKTIITDLLPQQKEEDAQHEVIDLSKVIETEFKDLKTWMKSN